MTNCNTFYDWLKVGPRTASVERVLVDNIEDKRYSDFFDYSSLKLTALYSVN